MATRGPRLVPEAIRQRLGARIRALREERALSQAEVARRCSTSTSQINAVERGLRSTTVVTLTVIATKGLGVPVASLFEGEDIPPPPTRSERAWHRIVSSLRDRDLEYLVALESLIKSFDRALMRAGPRARS